MTNFACEMIGFIPNTFLNIILIQGIFYFPSHQQDNPTAMC